MKVSPHPALSLKYVAQIPMVKGSYLVPVNVAPYFRQDLLFTATGKSPQVPWRYPGSFLAQHLHPQFVEGL